MLNFIMQGTRCNEDVRFPTFVSRSSNVIQCYRSLNKSHISKLTKSTVRKIDLKSGFKLKKIERTGNRL